MTSPFRLWLSLVFVCNCLVIHQPSAFAGLIASESFVYAEGDLAGNGGDGWAGSWSSPLTVQVVSPGMTYVDSKGNELSTAGRAIRTKFDPDGNAVRLIDLSVGSNANLAGAIDSGKLGLNGTSIWLSFLALGPSPTPDTSMNFHWGGLNLFDGGDEKIFFGKAADQSFLWSAFEVTQPIKFTTTLTTELVFYVAKIDFAAAGETIDVWLNPDLDQTPLLGDADLSFAVNNFQFDRIRFAGSDLFTFDELRMGTTFDSVSPYTAAVPEPTTFVQFALLFAGVFSPFARKRWKLRSL